MISLQKQRTAIYRFYDAGDRLLYVGISTNIGPRWAMHQNVAAWWTRALRTTIHWHRSRPTAAREELRAIVCEKPLYNLAGVPRLVSLVKRKPQYVPSGDGTWLTVGGAGTALGVSDSTVREYFKAGKLDNPIMATRLPGGHRRLHRDSVERLRREMYGED